MSDPTISINVAVTSAGAVPNSPVSIWENLITLVAGINPGYTVLPGGLIEDLASTATYAIALIDSAAVETINSLTPFGANPYLLIELGQIYGIEPGQTSNTSVYVVFSSSTPGLQIPPGYLVSDGTNQYQVQDGGVISSGGTSEPLYCLATQPGSFAVPAGTVTTIISSVAPAVTLSCTNPNPGTPSAGPQSQEEYAAQVLQAGVALCQGAASMVKTLLYKVPGVQPRLVACKQINGGGWEILCGGGDPYEVANAIFNSGVDISTLVGSSIGITGITKANPGVLTTNLNHGLTTGQTNVNIAGVLGMTAANGGPYTVTVISPSTFSFGVNTTGFGTYTSGGVVTPNPRNVVVDLSDFPDTYTVPFVSPPAQTVNLQLDWSTISPNFVSAAAVSQLGTAALVNYINSIPVGSPINLYAAEAAFVAAVLTLFNNNASLISAMTWTVAINGVSTAPIAGTFLVEGDPESYFTILSSAVTISQI